MNLTPLDIRKATFRRVLRGVDAEEVGAFLEVVAENYERVIQDHAKINERVSGLEDRIRHYEGMEKFLQQSMLTAEQLVSDAKDASRQKSEKCIEEAQRRAERILEDSRERLRSLSRGVRELESRKGLYVERFRSLLESHLRILEEHEEDLDEIENLGVEVSKLLSQDAGDQADGDDLMEDPVVLESLESFNQGEIGLAQNAEALSMPHPLTGPAMESSGDRHSEEGNPPYLAELEADEQGPEDGGSFFPPRVRRQGFFDIKADGETE
ncbi:MAG: DivIVA domain-containing protein [Candidatus Eisenbacteria bacterium]|uniref:DivIVA domain-containing protein n=1 Tax=Eiseniibacteriota bacterium TaxID=2212470 RepID=A0A948W7S5_UNCEI|nr:DivIVA domain-containing protein [Candidatus Eisenbacteria bacterium]MBU1948427.1 DivIVA domain-containing protein [Candidatus Eisenbacteria bacterium]MBU2692904.1 DivIVA domain-containing protein [Candidatus Eisenbacteria bacterium]